MRMGKGMCGVSIGMCGVSRGMCGVSRGSRRDSCDISGDLLVLLLLLILRTGSLSLGELLLNGGKLRLKILVLLFADGQIVLSFLQIVLHFGDAPCISASYPTATASATASSTAATASATAIIPAC